MHIVLELFSALENPSHQSERVKLFHRQYALLLN